MRYKNTFFPLILFVTFIVIYQFFYLILAVFHQPEETIERTSSMIITDRSWAASITHLLFFSERKVYFEPNINDLPDTIIFIGHGNYEYQWSSGIYYKDIKDWTVIENYTCSGKDTLNHLQIIKGNNTKGMINLFEIFLIKYGIIDLTDEITLDFIYLIYYCLLVYFISYVSFLLIKRYYYNKIFKKS